MLPSAVYTLFKSQHGVSIATLNEHIEAIPKISEKSRKKHSSPLEIAGRGYVYFGHGVNARKADKRNREIMKSW